MLKSAATASTSAPSPRAKSLLVAGWLLLALPLLLYAAVAIRTSVNIPFEDDFDSIGDFLEHYVSLHGFLPHLWWILTAQHVQYKLMLMDAIVALQYHLIGHTNYRALQLLGDLAIPATVLVLWVILARSGRPLVQRVWLFVPACSVFFALRYAETVNWTMSGLQNTAVIPLALATVFFATSTKPRSFAWTLVFLVLSIAASGSGFFVVLAVLYLLLRSRRLAHAAIAAAVTCGMAALYAVHYRVYMVYAPVPLSTAIKSIVLFPFAFLGNCANSPAQAVALGVFLVVIFAWFTWRGWYRVCPASFGGALFCLITSLVVAAGRYRVGYQGALAGHYVMYSLLLIAVEWIGFVQLFVPEALDRRWTLGLALAAVASIGFCLWADYYGYRDLHARQRDMIAHLILWERHPDHLVLVPDEDPSVRKPEWLSIRITFQQDLQRHIAEGLYVPPYTAADPLPIRPHSPATVGIEDELPPTR